MKAIYQTLDQVLLVHVLRVYVRYRIRYPDPAIKVNDTVKIDLSNGKHIHKIPSLPD